MSSAASAPIIGIRDEVVALKRERTIAVAAELFYQRGYENTSLDAIAEQMNVTKPFIYAHFTSKAELLAEICARGIASALDALESVLDSVQGTPRDRLQEVGHRFAASVLNSQRHIAIFAREEKNLALEDFRRISELRRTFDRKLVELLDEGVALGDFDIPDTRMAALAIGGMVSWAYVWYRPDGRLTLEQTSHALTQLILNLVGTKEPTKAAPPPRRDAGRRTRRSGLS
jgi:AcrR family transcriptional regulator